MISKLLELSVLGVGVDSFSTDVDDDDGGGWTLELLPRPALTLLTILAPNTCDEPNPEPIILPVRLLDRALPTTKLSFSFPLFELDLSEWTDDDRTVAAEDDDGAGDVADDEANDNDNDKDDSEARDDDDDGDACGAISFDPPPPPRTARRRPHAPIHPPTRTIPPSSSCPLFPSGVPHLSLFSLMCLFILVSLVHLHYVSSIYASSFAPYPPSI